jgi:dihydrolipoamide dehydrogenase
MASRNINLHLEGYHPSNLLKTTFDVVVIGGGPAANTAEARLAKAGLDVAVVQHELYGGECHFFGCVPSKALLRPVEAFEVAKGIEGAREAVGESKIDVNAVFKRRDGIIDLWDDKNWIVKSNGASGATLIRGFGSIAGERKVSIQPYGENERYILEARVAVVVATGSAHVVPSIPGIEDLEAGKELWINRDAVAANVVPEHLIVLGAGPVGCEMATFYSAVGAKVTIIASSEQILPKVELEAARIVQEALEEKGVTIKTSARATKIEKLGPNELNVELSNGEVVSGTVLLTATGRKSRTFDFGLDTVGIQGEGKALETNSSLAVPLPGAKKSWLYAVGDVNGLTPTKHMGIYQARIASNAILASARSSHLDIHVDIPKHFSITETPREDLTFSQVIFTEPNIGTVGLTLASAQAAGLNVRVADSAFDIAGAMLYGNSQKAWARWVIEEGSERLVGATFVSAEGAEFVNAAQVATSQGMTLRNMVHIVPPFPTRGEIWTGLIDAAGY